MIRMKWLRWLSCSQLALVCGVSVAQAPGGGALSLDIESQGVGDALALWASQTKYQVLFPSDDFASRKTPTVKGSYTAEEALRLLLSNTSLRYQFVNYRTVAIRVAQANEPAASARTNAPASAQLAERTSAGLEEVIVTAQKREERLQDVPVPVSVISSQALTDTNRLQLQDYYTQIPGFSVSPTPSAAGETLLAVRGITTGFGTLPTVGVVIDDVPFGSSTGYAAPDIDPGDLARIEVLRGPQGTLYGASSMGGLLKYVTVDPSTEQVTGRLQAGASGVKNGDGLGYNVRGAVNVPVGDTFAVRASAYTREDPGYIDNPVRGEEGLNKTTYNGGRVAGMWQPSDTVSLRLSAIYQHSDSDGSSNVDMLPGLGDLQQNYLPGIGGTERKAQAYSAIFKADLGNAELTSLSGFNRTDFDSSLDFTYLVGSTAQALFGVSGAPVFTSGSNRKFTEEVRVAMPFGERVEWLAGGFYAYEKSNLLQILKGQNPTTGELVGSLQAFSNDTTFREYALFTDLTYHFTDRFDVQVGGRESQIYRLDTPKANVFTYLFTPRFKFSDNLMMYARAASGYRSGQPNFAAPGIPAASQPDRTKTYEVGMKGSTANRTLSFDASLYYIDWNDIQLLLFDSSSTFSYRSNGSRAKSQGVELSVEARPLNGLTIATWVVYSEAELTEDFPPGPVYGVSGNRLPNSSKISGNLSIAQEFPLGSNMAGTIGADIAYMGDSFGILTGTPQRQRFGGYTRIDLRGGVQYGTWAMSAYVNNVADRRSPIGGGIGTFPPFAFTYIQPRTAGFSVAKSF